MGTRRPGLLSVGELARRVGLTTKALRHYDHVGLLEPARVSEDGYRWYTQDQIARARRIARLRALDLPLDMVAAVLSGTEQQARQVLARHRAALQARHDRIGRALHAADHLIDDEQGIHMALDDTPADTITDERALAGQLFNDTWTLLQKEERTAEEDDRMIHTAHAARFHWDNVGNDQNRAVGEWQLARVYATLGRGEPAIFHATRCLDYAQRPGHDDWLQASAWEAMARAQATAGDLDAARDARDRARTLLDDVADPEDRKIVTDDINTLPLCD